MLSNVKEKTAEKVDNKRRLVGLDILRIILAVLVLAFHSNGHFGCTYGVLNNFVSMGAISMTGFFLLSGYSNFYVYSNTNMHDKNGIVKFLKKRMIGILPSYYFASLIFVIFVGEESIFENIILAPMELWGIQTIFPSTFELTHNGGTWFVSCILISYLIFPYLSEMIKQLEFRAKLMLGAISIMILLYAPIVTGVLDLGFIYNNPWFRLLEFFVGMLLASVREKMIEYTVFNYLRNKIAIILESCLLIFSISVAYELGIARGNFLLYSWIALPLFILLIFSFAEADFRKIENAKIISYMSAISYAFFLVQLFLWPLMRKVVSIFNITNNVMKIIASFMVCTTVAIVVYEFIEKPCKKALLRKFVK